MDDLHVDSENVQNIIDHLEGNDVKTVNPIRVAGEPVNIKCLWSEGDGQLSLEVLQDGIKVKSPDDDPSLGGHEISENSSDQILDNEHELHVNQLKQEAESDENSILTAGEIAEGHILHVHDNVGTILSDSPGNMPATTSLAGDLTSQTAQDVIQLLLPTSDENAGNSSTGLPSMNVDTNAMTTGDIGTPSTQTIQAITLADGNTAFIQHPGGSKFLEGQTITLDDGTTAVIQAIPDKLNLMSSIPNQNIVRTDGNSTTQVHLEDTTFLNQAVKALLKKKPKSLAAFKEDVQWATGEQRFISDSGEKNPHYATDSECPHDPIDQDEDPQDMHDHVDDSGDQQSLMSDNNSPHNPVNHHEDVDYMYDNEAANTDYKHDNLADTGSPHDPIDQHEEQVYTGDNVLHSDRQLEPADQHKSPQDMHDHLDDSGDQQSLMSDNNSPHNPVNHHEDVDYMYDNEAANTDYIHDNLADTGSPHDPIDQHEEQVYTGDNVLDSDRQLEPADQHKSPQDMHDHLDDSCDSDSCASTIWPCLGRFCKPGSPEEIVDSEEEVNPPKRRRLDHDNIAQSEKVSDTNNPEIFEKITDINNSEIFVRKIIFSKTFNDKQKKNDRVQNSVHACYFCDIVRSHIQDHLLRKHSDQKEIMDIIKRGNDKNEQENLKSLIRAKGNHKHNLNVISEKKGELILFRRPKENFDSAQFGPCPKCLEWMMCKSLPKHQKTCKGYSQEGDEFVPKKSYLQAMSDFKKGIIKKEVSPVLLKEVFTIMRTDNVGVVAKSDGLIIDLGEKWLKSCIDNPTKRPYWASQHMRHAAKLLIELRMLDRADAEKDKTPLEDEEKCLWEFLRPAYFDNIVKASLNTALPDFDDIDDLKSPSNALKIKYDIITMAERKASKSNQKYDKTNLPEWKQSKKEAEGLLAEITREWKNKVTKVAKKVLLERKVMKKEQLPHPRDIEKLAKYLKEELVNADLSKSTVTWPYYKQLCKYAQTRLMSYNKRRSGEVENVTVKNYMNKLQMDDIDEGLIGEITQLERYLMETHDLIQVRGKKSSVVPMLIPPECTSVINFLADREVRSRVGINPKNDYLFPNKDVASIRAYDSLSEICAECQLQKPERISSTSMRKYMATVSQVMNLDPNQLQWVCRHLGHTQKVHLNNYRAMSPYLERVKIGKMLLLQELNLQSKFAGKNPDDIDFFDLLQDNASTVQDNAATNEDNLHADQSATGIFEVEPTAVETEPLDDEEDAVSVVESDVSVEEVTSKKSSICKKLSMKKRQKWTIEEEKEIRKYFQKNLERKITPGKVECVKAKQLSLKAGDGLQAIILEDGTTAYLATQQTPGGAGGLIDSSQLESTTLTLDQLTSPGVSGVQTVLTNGLVNVDPKPLASTSTKSEVTAVPGSESKGAVALPTYTTDKVGPFLEKAYRCGFEQCGKYYTTLHHLRVHERSHTGDRPFKCEYENCGKAFATGYGLKSHTRVHTGEKPYKCHEEGCDKAFKTSGDLQKHIRTHTGERPFKCPFEGCTRSFTTSNIRKVHIRTHTGERPYLCPQEGCGRAFASATNYKNHVRIHTGEKPYVCTVMGCGKRFTEYSSLYKHHVVHTHAKPYTCSRCGKTYRQTSTLAMHKRTTHGEDVTAESEALLYQEQAQAESLEPPGKRMRLGLVNQDDLAEDGEGALIISAPDATQQLAFVGSEGLTAGVDILQPPLNSQTTLLQQAGVAFTLSDQGQQVFVITDPAQLEALQQIAKHQLESDTDPQSLLTTTLTSDDINTAQNADNIVTMVTEITTESEVKNNAIVTVSSADVTDIGNE